MNVVKISPLNDGKQTEITLSMAADEAKRFMQLLENGQLAQFGISGAVIRPVDAASPEKQGWTEAERAKDLKQHDKASPDLP